MKVKAALNQDFIPFSKISPRILWVLLLSSHFLLAGIFGLRGLKVSHPRGGHLQAGGALQILAGPVKLWLHSRSPPLQAEVRVGACLPLDEQNQPLPV